MRNELFQEVLTLRKEVAELKAMVLERTVNSHEQTAQTRDENTDERIIKILHELRISANLSGYKYLIQAIKRVYEDGDYVGTFTKELYPEIAKKFQTLPNRVERAIRHAIESSYSRNYFHPFYQVSYKDKKPTNSQFIFEIADQLMREEKSKSEVM